jgi:hypothetical protein
MISLKLLVTEERKKERKNCIGGGGSQVPLMLTKVVSGWVVESYQKPNSS